MSQAALIARDSAALLLSRILLKLIGGVFFIVLARLLGAAEMGLYTLAFTLLNFCSLLSAFGLNNLLIRDVAQDPTRLDRYMTAALLLRLGLAVLCLGGLLAAGWALDLAVRPRRLLLLFGLLLFPEMLYKTVGLILNIGQRIAAGAAIAVAGTVLRVLLGLGALALGMGLEGVLGAYLVAGLLEAGIVLGTVAATSRLPRPAFDGPFTRRLVREALPFAAISLLGVIYFKLDFVMLAAYRDAAEVGIYGVCYALVDFLMYVPFSLTTAAFPVVVRRAAEAGSLRRMAEQAGRWLLLIGLPVPVVGVLLGTPLLTLLYGEAYRAGGSVVAVLLWAVPGLFLNALCADLLYARGAQRVALAILAVGIVANVGLNLWLIPPLGAVGAAAATVVTEALTLALSLTAVGRTLGVSPRLDREALKPVLASGGMALALWPLREAPLAASIPVGAAAYLAAVLLLRAIPPEDRRILGDLLRRLGGARIATGA
ncbi:MAG TPA: oligosaccharide flippase family protein [Candidatus Methylomirabilis sp.]|nr:oligosaccharide flippase family protein [Candidatus Methylomirabilis sp.]